MNKKFTVSPDKFTKSICWFGFFLFCTTSIAIFALVLKDVYTAGRDLPQALVAFAVSSPTIILSFCSLLAAIRPRIKVDGYTFKFYYRLRRCETLSITEITKRRTSIEKEVSNPGGGLISAFMFGKYQGGSFQTFKYFSGDRLIIKTNSRMKNAIEFDNLIKNRLEPNMN